MGVLRNQIPGVNKTLDLPGMMDQELFDTARRLIMAG